VAKLPKLAIVGRPNVGKSALFNRICQRKIAIVDEAEGITRDRLYAKAELFGLQFEVIDTGGIHANSPLPFNEEVKRQAEIAIEEADTIIQVVDAHIGITLLDKEVSKMLLRTRKPVCLAVNKIDNLEQAHLLNQFYALGIAPLVPVSAAQGWQIAELLETAFANISKNENNNEAYDDTLKIAVVGRANVGKSSLVNYILDEERCIVSPIPGTTRDSIDVAFEYEGQPCLLIDTAGIRRKGAEHEVVDKFAAIRTERAIERADLCLLMLDAREGITAQDKKIANRIEEAGKGCIILLNKWDLIKGCRMEHCLKNLEENVPFLKHCPKIFISVAEGRNIDKIFPAVQMVHVNAAKRISTPELNKFIALALQKNHPTMLNGKRLRIYYMAQVGISPPKFILFVNSPNLMIESYKKYLYNQMRQTFDFGGVPLLLFLRGKVKRERPEPAKPKHDYVQEHAAAKEMDETFDDDEFDDESIYDE